MRHLAYLLGVLAAVACSGSNEPAGYNCSSTKECGEGLTCFLGEGTGGGGCLLPTLGQCSKTCTSDADCNGLSLPSGDTGYTCIPACSNGAPQVSYCAAGR